MRRCWVKISQTAGQYTFNVWTSRHSSCDINSLLLCPLWWGHVVHVHINVWGVFQIKYIHERQYWWRATRFKHLGGGFTQLISVQIDSVQTSEYKQELHAHWAWNQKEITCDQRWCSCGFVPFDRPEARAGGGGGRGSRRKGVTWEAVRLLSHGSCLQAEPRGGGVLERSLRKEFFHVASNNTLKSRFDQTVADGDPCH